MAVGDRIGGARTTAIMRRANRLEDDLEYALTGTSVKVLDDYTPDASIGNGDFALFQNNNGILYFLPTNHPTGGIFTCSETLVADSAVCIVSSSTSESDTALFGTSRLSVFNDVMAVRLTNDHPLARTSVRTYDTDGNKIADVYMAPEGPEEDWFDIKDVAVLSDGTVAAPAWKRDFGEPIQYGILLLPSESFTEITEWGTSTGDIQGCENGIIAILPDTANNSLDINLYNNSMSLQKTFVVGDAYSDKNAPFSLARANGLIAINANTGILWLDLDLGFAGTSNGNVTHEHNFTFGNDMTKFVGVTTGTTTKAYEITPLPTTATITDFFRYPANYPTSSRISLGTFPNDTQLAGNIYRPHSEEIKDIRDVLDTITTNYTTGLDAAKGKTDGTGTNKLVDSTASFTSTVNVNDVIYDLSTALGAIQYVPQTVTAIDSDSTLSISGTFVSGTQYLIRDTLVLTGVGNNNVFKAAGFSIPYEWQPDDDDIARILESIYSGIESVMDVLESAAYT